MFALPRLCILGIIIIYIQPLPKVVSDAGGLVTHTPCPNGVSFIKFSSHLKLSFAPVIEIPLFQGKVSEGEYGQAYSSLK